MMRRRLLLFFIAPLLALLLVVVLLYSVRSAQSTTLPVTTGTVASAVWTPAAATATTAAGTPAETPAETPATLPPAMPLPVQPQAQEADLIAVVNGKQLTADQFALAQSVDRVMSGLLAAEPAGEAQLLDRMINSALVGREGAASGAAPAVDAAARLAALLAAAGKTQADLTDALAAVGVKRAAFDQYFADLLTVQEFARRAAEEEGSSVDAYIGALQAAAHISYGPAAAAIATRLASAPAATAPAATAPAPEQAGTPTGTPINTQTFSTAPPATPATDEARGLAVGQLAPDFALPASGDEQPPTAFADLLGQPLVLSFWTTWCPYCLRQTPVLVAGAERYTGAVRFVGVNVAEDAAAVAPYVEQHAIPYLILLDRESQAAAAYAVEGYPSTYFLDATGHIVTHHIGSLSEEQLTQYVEQLLAPQS